MKKIFVLVMPSSLLLPTIIFGGLHNVYCHCPVKLDTHCICTNTGTGDNKVTGAVTFGIDAETTTYLAIHCTNHPKNLPISYNTSLGKNDLAVRCLKLTSNKWNCHNWAPVLHNITVDRIFCSG